ncbi:MAG: DUF4390 domain-containing protein [candidate division KSB1 bacterium]|nr:DUF4390 domain-containing protein [candidate division KSB1 bacterium]
MLAATSGFGQAPRIALDSLRIEDNYCVIDFHVDSLLNQNLLAGMRRGLTSSAQFRVQLWRKRGLWFGSTLLATRQYEIKSTYDQWEQKYVLITPGEKRLTNKIDGVRQRWEQHHGVALIETMKLRPSQRYFVTIELQIEPLSKETLNAIRGWLAGEVKSMPADSADTGDEQKHIDVPERFLQMLLNVTGFGKRMLSMKSEMFELTAGGAIEKVK